MSGQAPGQAAPGHWACDFCPQSFERLTEAEDHVRSEHGAALEAAPHDDGTTYCTNLPPHEHDLTYRAAPEPKPAREPWAGSGFAALGTTADLDGDAPDEVRELAALRSGIAGLAADLDRSAAETRPSRKSETESETAIALRRLLETP